MINFDELKQKNLIRLMKERNLNPTQLAKLMNRSIGWAAHLLLPFGDPQRRSIGRIPLDILCKGLEVEESEFFQGIDIFLGKNRYENLPIFGEKTDFLIKEETPLYGNFKYIIHESNYKMAPRFLPGDQVILGLPAILENGDFVLIKKKTDHDFVIYNETETDVRFSYSNSDYPQYLIFPKERKDAFQILGRAFDMVPKIKWRSEDV